MCCLGTFDKTKTKRLDVQLDPAKRYFVARPRGGLNDQLVQIERAAAYTEKFNRVLVLDTSHGSLRVPIDLLFDLSGWYGPELIVMNDDIKGALDQATSVHPAHLTHDVSRRKMVKIGAQGDLIDRETEQPLSCDLGRDHDAQVLYFETVGGGRRSLRALRRLRFQPKVAQTIAERLLKLGRGYDAVHVRHSDYQSRFARFLMTLRPVLRGRRVLFCSDSVEAIAAARQILAGSTTLLSVSDIPDIGGKPLHMSPDVDVDKTNIDLLSDLMAMSMSETLYFTKVSGKYDERLKTTLYSGFSVLAEMLRRNPEIVKNLFFHITPAQREQLFAPHPVQSGLLRYMQLRAQKVLNRHLAKMEGSFRHIKGNGSLPP
jgi:hypothetical protein